MLRFPYRQVFGDPDERDGQQFFDLDPFRVTIDLTTLAVDRRRRLDASAAMTDRTALPPDAIREVTRSKRFLAADRANLDVGEIATWDPVPAARAPPAGADRRAGAVRAAGQQRADGAPADARRRPQRQGRHRP